MNMTEEFEIRWANWIRWCVAKGLHQARTGSLEGGYSGPQGNGHPSGWGDWNEAAPPVTRPRVHTNVPDAIEVNRAYVQLWINSPTHAQAIKVLTFRPYSELRPQRQAQILGVHYLRLPLLLEKSKKMLENLLR